MTKNVTIKELAELLGEDYLTTSGLVKFLAKLGAVKEVGKKSVEGKRGKPSIIYEIPNMVELVFWDENEAETEVVEHQEEAATEETAEVTQERVDTATVI